MFTHLMPHVVAMLRCPLCKAHLDRTDTGFFCPTCATAYPLRPVDVGSHTEPVADFRVARPAYCIPSSSQAWQAGQHEYESFHETGAARDELAEYRDEIAGVREIYQDEFALRGAVLDVGGHQGRVRQFLSAADREVYVSVDPLLAVFKGIERQRNLLIAYPSLAEPCNFLAARAEALPFASDAFDWVHMRSVVDHFEDPFLALKEAYRVLKPGGRVLIGLAVVERLSTANRGSLGARAVAKLRTGGRAGLLRAALRKSAGAIGIDLHNPDDHHIFHLSYEQLADLLAVVGFRAEKVHWQRPPFDYCVYLSASVQKPAPATRATLAETEIAAENRR
jgi:SAM-dependent methyltransferase